MSITTSILKGTDNSYSSTSEMFNALSTDMFGEGVIGTITNTAGVAPNTGAFAVNAQGTPDMTVAVTSGVAYVTATPTGQSSQLLRINMSANQNVTIAANSTGGTRYDWVYIKVDPTLADAPNATGTDASTLVTSRSTSSTTDDGTPPTYGYPIAVVTVANGAASIANGSIADKRTNVGMKARVAFAAERTTSVTYTVGVDKLMPLDTIIYDYGDNFDTTNNKFTAPVDGIYYFHGRAVFTTNAALTGDLISVRLFKNGSIEETLVGKNSPGANSQSMAGSMSIMLNAGDYIQLYILNNTTNGLAITNSRLDGFLVGEV